MRAMMSIKFSAIILFLSILLWCFPAFADALDDDLASQWETREIPAFTGDAVFSSAHRFELGLNLGVIPNDDYYNYIPISIDVHYRFTEMWGLMVRGSLLMLHTDTTLMEFMDSHSSAMDPKFLSDEQRGDFTAMATFHPVYGKSTVGTKNLVRFDWGLLAGIGVVVSESANSSRTSRDKSGHFEGVFGTDFHVFFRDWIALRLEASMRFYHAPTQWVVPCTLSAGVSFFLPEI